MWSGSVLRHYGGPRATARVVVRCVACLAAILFAAAPSTARADDDLPAVVGRIAEFAGQLFLSTQERPDDWMPVDLNYPVTTGDNLWVSGSGRAEVDYGGGQFRFLGDTSLNVSRLDDRQLTLFVARGSLIIRVRLLDAGDTARIDTPNTQVALTRTGLYRIDVSPDGRVTSVTVREGEGLIGLAYGMQQALAGQAATVIGIDPITADVRNGAGADGFDLWSASRDRHYERAGALAYVPREMVGSAELDAYGRWESDATYGAIWYPAAAEADWAPYRDGYWTNVGAWGLTWVDSAAWGYAPSHYGRWVRVGGRWAWCPGPRAGRPRWAPALVGWYGGAGWGFTANAGAPVYGWVPLGWGDAYHPWWHGCSQSCWNRYNRPWGVNGDARSDGPPARYSHTGVPGAMTAVAGAALVGRKPVRQNMVALPASQAPSAPMLATAPSLVPGSGTAPVFRPGERGTPTPASALYTHAKRNPAFAAPAPTASGPAAGVPAAAAGTVVRGRPALPGGTAAPGTAVVQAGATLAGAPAHSVTAPGAQSKAVAPREVAPLQRPTPASDPAAPPASQQQAVTRPAPASAPVPPAGPQQQAVTRPGSFPASGMALPTPSTLSPSVLSPPVHAPPLPAPPVGSVGVAVPRVVAPPVVAAPPESVQGKPAGDADAAKAGKPADRTQPGSQTPR